MNLKMIKKIGELVIDLIDKEIEPAMALSFYPRLENRTEVTVKHAILIFEKMPDGNFQKNFLKGGET
jgi:hypothetical protein